MDLYEVPSLLELVTRSVSSNLNDYSISQLFAIPVTTKDLIRIKALRRLSNLSPARFSALLHDHVQTIELGSLNNFNKDKCQIITIGDISKAAIFCLLCSM